MAEPTVVGRDASEKDVEEGPGWLGSYWAVVSFWDVWGLVKVLRATKADSCSRPQAAREWVEIGSTRHCAVPLPSHCHISASREPGSFIRVFKLSCKIVVFRVEGKPLPSSFLEGIWQRVAKELSIQRSSESPLPSDAAHSVLRLRLPLPHAVA